MPVVKKAVGQRGSWFAAVDAEKLPCVHAHWFKGREYDDPDARPDDAGFQELFAAIRDKKRVILTKDEVLYTGEEHTGFQRTGYVAVFSVSDPVLDERGLRFQFIKRLFNLE